jgi:Txe/YoeB family toxin of Txe-Axe toxin-antitoxin module
MTESSPEIQVIGSVQTPVVTSSNTLILNDSAVVLGTSGTNLNSVIADINDANIPGITASKTDDSLVLTYTPTNGVWTFIIGAGTANTELGLTQTTITAENPSSVDYYSVWRGFSQDRILSDRMNNVIKSLEAKGFNIIRKTNPLTNTTFEWYVQW